MRKYKSRGKNCISYLTRLKKLHVLVNGEDIYCPNVITAPVYHFAWSALPCDGCNETLKKRLWVSSDPSKFSKRITLCNPKEYYIDKNSVGEVSYNGQRLDAKYSPNTINSHF